MADAFGLDSDVYFGDAEKPLPNWRKDAAHETDDNNEDEPQPGVAEMLGFDPAELSEPTSSEEAKGFNRLAEAASLLWNGQSQGVNYP